MRMGSTRERRIKEDGENEEWERKRSVEKTRTGVEEVEYEQ